MSESENVVYTLEQQRKDMRRDINNMKEDIDLLERKMEHVLNYLNDLAENTDEA